MPSAREYKYILNEDGEPVAEPDVLKWAEWMWPNKWSTHRVLKTAHVGEVVISTVFLGIDHGLGLSDVPILWETMIFGGPLDRFQQRYHTKQEAIVGHEKVVQKVEADMRKRKKLCRYVLP